MEFVVEQVIHASPEEIARIMFDPDLEGRWVGKDGRAEQLSAGPVAVGTRVRHDGAAVGFRTQFVTEVTELEPGRRLAMEIVEGPERGLLVYQIAPTSGGAIAAVHVRNNPKLPLPLAPWARKHQIQENLHRLASLVTQSHRTGEQGQRSGL